MAAVLAVLVVLAGLMLTVYAAIRVDRARWLRNEQGRWARLAVVLGAELTVGEDGWPRLRARCGDFDWELRTDCVVSRELEGLPVMDVRFDGAERLAPAIVWRDPPDGAVDRAACEAVGSEDMRAVFVVEQAPVPAGCVRWVDDREIQDLLLAVRPRAAAVIEPRGTPPRAAVWIVLDRYPDEDRIRLAIDWARRMALLAREGAPAVPPH
jgi:hypothetical protein